MNNEDIKGYLKKKKSSAFKRLISNTNLRWFELKFKNEIFTYKKSKSDEQYEKKFSFNSITNVTTELKESDSKMSSWKYGFKIIFKDHEMILFSESERDRMMWLNGFRTMFQMVRSPVKETNIKTQTVINDEINRKTEIKKENEVVKEIKNERKEEEEGDEEEEDDEGENEEEEEESEEEESESKEKEEEYEKRIKEEEKKEKEKKLQVVSKVLKIDNKIKDSKESSIGNSTKRENNQMFIINEESPKPTVREQDEVKRTNEKDTKMVQQIKFSDDSPRPIIKLIKPESVEQSNKDSQSNNNKDNKSKESSQPSKKENKKDVSKESSVFHQSLHTESHKQSIQLKPIINDVPKESNQPSIKETHSQQSTIKSKQSSKKEINVKVQNPIIPPKKEKDISKPKQKESIEKKAPSPKNTIRSKSQNIFPSMIDNHSIHSIYTPEQDSIIQSAISDIIENNDLFTNHFESSIFTSDSFIHNSSNNSSMINCNDNDLDDWNFYDDDKKLIAENDLINFNPLSNRIETKKIIKAKKKISNKEAINELNKNNIKSFKEPIYISTSNSETEDKKVNSKKSILKETKNTSFELITKKAKCNNQKLFPINGKKYKNSIVKALEKENERKYTNVNNTSIKKIDIYSMNKQKKEEPNIDNFIYKKHIIGVSNKIEEDLYSFGSKNTNNPYNVF